MSSNEIRRPRRIVTGHDERGRSIIVSDGPTPNAFRSDETPNVAMFNLWRSDATPASNRGNDDACPAGVGVPLPPPARGSVLRIGQIPPDRERNWNARRALFSQHLTTASGESPRHPGFHKTDTLDYAIVLEGEVWALLDEGETLMRPGDVLIQRGTNHAWSNRSDKPCRIAWILIDAEPAP